MGGEQVSATEDMPAYRLAQGERHVPSHVPPSLVREIDCLAPPGFEEDVHAAWRAIQEENPPLFWSPFQGGHWVATSGTDIMAMQRNVGLFSHAKYVVPFDPATPPSPPANTDGPLHTRYRGLIVPYMGPRAVAAMETDIRAIARSTIAALKPRGGCEFVRDFARVLPIIVFLQMAGMPLEDRDHLLDLAHKAARPVSAAERIEALTGMQAYLAAPIAQRRGGDGVDLISAIVNGDMGGRPASEAEALAICTTVMLGGLDTVASLMGFIAWHLAEHPEDRRILIGHAEKLPDAVEELIRRHGVANTARMLTRDHEQDGVLLMAGDQILLPNALVGLDEAITPGAMRVDFDRPAAGRMPRHAAFGNGPHACPGAGLARRELRIFLEEWLAAIPDFRLAQGARPLCATGTINAVQRLDLIWDASR